MQNLPTTPPSLVVRLSEPQGDEDRSKVWVVIDDIDTHKRVRRGFNNMTEARNLATFVANTLGRRFNEISRLNPYLEAHGFPPYTDEEIQAIKDMDEQMRRAGAPSTTVECDPD